MSANYTAILWNQQKKLYDRYMWLGIGLFMLVYAVFQLWLQPSITFETLIIRATALAAFVLLHLILAIGPLSRINPAFLPLLYNRRHAGVSMFILALIHGAFCIIQFHALSDTNPLISVFISNPKYLEISQFPFQTLGFLALMILFLMAATSHDFWLSNLSPAIWKVLHMGVYVAYALIVLHVATGAFQYENHPFNWILLFIGFWGISGLHVYAGFSERYKLNTHKNILAENGFYQVCRVNEIENTCAKTAFINGENIAIFKYDGKISAIHNVCKHQMGPLGEGRIVDGCITCPWHGYQYLPHNGQSPPPFTEKVKTYDVKILEGYVWVNPVPKEEGTFVEPVIIEKA
ncbi:MAG: ferric reductase-like transmembrane domain-containing protein [Saprospiraceae bacterium]